VDASVLTVAVALMPACDVCVTLTSVSVAASAVARSVPVGADALLPCV